MLGRVVRTIACLLTPVLLGGLSACAGPDSMRAEVTRFHRFENQPPRSFAISDTSAQARSLEYRSYADLLSKRLIELGFTEAPSDVARYRIEFDARVAGDLSRAIAAMPGWGGYGWPDGPWPGAGPARPIPWGLAPYPGAWLGPGLMVPMDIMVYVHTLRISIIDTSPTGGGGPRTVFESNAVARSLEPALPRLMPGLVQALFAQFPGVDGTTQVIEVPLPAATGAAAQPVVR